MEDIIIKPEAIEKLKTDGYCVIENVFSKKESDELADRIVKTFELLGSGLDRENLHETWKVSRLPPQTRPGLFQRAMGFSLPVRYAVNHPKVKQIFTTVHQAVNPTQMEEGAILYSSIDGINVKPGLIRPYHPSADHRDWAHVDQMKTSKELDGVESIQGQIVLTDTSAAFRCTPKSHLVHDFIVNLARVGRSERSANGITDFWRVPSICHQVVKDHIAKHLPEGEEVQWQIPIHVPAGSMILWNSKLIHSAKLQDGPEPRSEPRGLEGWRCVVYVSYKFWQNVRYLRTYRKNNFNFRCMNHNMTRTYPLFNRYQPSRVYHYAIVDLLNNPKAKLPMVTQNGKVFYWNQLGSSHQESMNIGQYYTKSICPILEGKEEEEEARRTVLDLSVKGVRRRLTYSSAEDDSDVGSDDNKNSQGKKIKS